MSESPFDRVVDNERAHRRWVRWKKRRAGVRLHAWIYVIVVVSLGVAWATSVALGGERTPWFLPLALGWGAGVVLHALVVQRPWRERPTPPPGMAPDA